MKFQSEFVNARVHFCFTCKLCFLRLKEVWVVINGVNVKAISTNYKNQNFKLFFILV